MKGIIFILYRTIVVVGAYLVASLSVGTAFSITSWIIDNLRGDPTSTLSDHANTTIMIVLAWAVLLLVFTLPPILWVEWRRVTDWRYFAWAGIFVWAIFFGLLLLDQLGIEPLPELLFFAFPLLPPVVIGWLVYWWLTVKVAPARFRSQTS